MTRARTRRTVLSLALVLAATLPGCVAVAVGAGATLGVLYIQGEHQTDVLGTPAQAVAVAAQTVEDHGFILISSHADDLGGEVVARTVDDQRVRVTAQRLTSGESRLWVRIGALGSEALSHELLVAIRERLELQGPTRDVATGR